MKSDDKRMFFIGMCKLVGRYIFIILVGIYVNCYSISNGILFDMILPLFIIYLY